MAADGQTLFEWPAAHVDVSTYRHVEQCRAATDRVRFQTEQRKLVATRIWRDTMPFDESEWREPYDTIVPQTTRACLSRYANVDSVDLTDYRDLVLLYAYASWDDKARALALRKAATIAPGADGERLRLVRELTNLLAAPVGSWMKPPRFSLAEDIVVGVAPSFKDRVMRLRALQIPLDFAQRGADSALLRRAAARVTALGDSLTKKEWEAFADEGTALAFQDADSVRAQFALRLAAVMEGTFGDAVLLDSLRRSTAAYAALLRSTFKRVFGDVPENHPAFPVAGKPAPPVTGDLWTTPSGARDSSRQIPIRGRVSVILIPPESCFGGSLAPYAFCAGSLHALSRLMRRFPQLDVTVITRTFGHYKYLNEGITDSVEAELTRKSLESHGVRARLVTRSTPFIRLKAPDDRRVDRPESLNEDRLVKNYPGGMTLIDQDGVIVHSEESLNRESEPRFARRIQALLDRQAGRVPGR